MVIHLLIEVEIGLLSNLECIALIKKTTLRHFYLLTFLFILAVIPALRYDILFSIGNRAKKKKKKKKKNEWIKRKEKKRKETQTWLMSVLDFC